MADSYMIITEKDWENATPKQQGWMMFNTMQSMHKRLAMLEKRSLANKAVTFAGGIIGGALAYIGIKVAQ